MALSGNFSTENNYSDSNGVVVVYTLSESNSTQFILTSSQNSNSSGFLGQYTQLQDALSGRSISYTAVFWADEASVRSGDRYIGDIVIEGSSFIELEGVSAGTTGSALITAAYADLKVKFSGLTDLNLTDIGIT